jgi:hypothetical protein
MDEATRKTALRTAVAVGSTLLVLNVVFWPLSALYFEQPDAAFWPLSVLWSDDVSFGGPAVLAVRGAFAIMTGVVAIATFLAALAPRPVGHAIALLMGLGMFFGGILAYLHGLPAVVVATNVVIGALSPPLAYLSWRRVRAAWSFLIAICGVFAGTTFFGAPRLRTELGVSLWHAMVVPGLYTVAVISLAMLRADYHDQGAGVRSK